MKKTPIGVYDDPKNQKQALFELDLQKSNIVVFGVAMSGKTTFIKNLLIHTHRQYTPDTENIYIIDFSGALLKYRNLGFVCSCFDNSNEENIKRLFSKLESILTSNTKILGGVNFPEYSKTNKPPHTTLIIENFNGFLADKRYEPYQENLLKLCREGLSKGVTIILTATDTSGGVNRFISNFGQKIAFELPSDKLLEVFGSKIGTPISLVGRGLANINNQVYEFQGFLPFKDEDKEFASFEEEVNLKFSSFSIPKIISFDGELTNNNFENFSVGHQRVDGVNQTAVSCEGFLNPITVGLDYYDLKPVTLDLYKTPSIGIFGKRQSGKTNLLWLLMDGLIKLKNANGLRFVLFEDGRKQLNAIADYLNKLGIDVNVITQISDMKAFLFDEKYYKTDFDEYELKDNPFTVFVVQNKSTFTGKADELMRKIFPEMLSEAENKWMFVYSDIKNITEIDMRNPFNDSLSVAFLLDNIGEFVADRGAKTIFGAMDAKELKERYARIEKGDGYFYDIESDELLKLKFIYSSKLKNSEDEEGI